LESAEKFNPFLRNPLPGDVRRGERVRPVERRHHKLAINRVHVIQADETEDDE
jgi:hypothetical protein